MSSDVIRHSINVPWLIIRATTGGGPKARRLSRVRANFARTTCLREYIFSLFLTLVMSAVGASCVSEQLSFSFFFEIARGLITYKYKSTNTAGKKLTGRYNYTSVLIPSGRTQSTPYSTVLNSKLDQHPDEAWGGNSVFNRDPHRGEDPNPWCTSVPPPTGWGGGERPYEKSIPAIAGGSHANTP